MTTECIDCGKPVSYRIRYSNFGSNFIGTGIYCDMCFRITLHRIHNDWIADTSIDKTRLNAGMIYMNPDYQISVNSEAELLRKCYKLKNISEMTIISKEVI